MTYIRRLGGGGGGGGTALAAFNIPLHAGAALAIANPTDDTEWSIIKRGPYILPVGVPCWARMSVSGNVNGSAGSVLKPVGGVGIAVDFGCTVPIDAINGQPTVTGAWVEVAEAAKGDFVVTAKVDGGNGVADPAFSSVMVHITFEDPP